MSSLTARLEAAEDAARRNVRAPVRWIMSRRDLSLTLALLAPLLAPLSGCISNTSGSVQQSTDTVTINGYTNAPNQTVQFALRNRRAAAVGATPTESQLGSYTFSGGFFHFVPLTAVTAATEVSAGSGLYAFSVTVPSSMLPASAWASQADDGRLFGGLRASLGRLEIVTRAAGSSTPLLTYTAAAQTCAGNTSTQAAARACADGDSLLLFDNDGVGVAAATSTFTTVTSTPSFLVPDTGGVTMEIGRYNVPGVPSLVGGIVCKPGTSMPTAGWKTVVLNHGGFELDRGALDACVNWARAGYLTALTTYRFERATALPVPTGPHYTYPAEVELLTASGNPAELCLGEVTDALRWLDLVRARPDTDDANILLWGYSHGACVTLRALEQGAKVKAAVSVAAPTDFPSWDTFLASVQTPTEHDAFHALLGGDTTTLPDAYTARSSARTAVDLKRRSDVKTLLIAVLKDTTVHVSQSCLLANAIGAENHLLVAGGGWSYTTSPLGIDYAGCSSGYLTWTPGAPTSFDKRAMLYLYDNTSGITGHAWFGYATPPPGGGAWTYPGSTPIQQWLAVAMP